MCIAIYQPENKVITKEILKNCFTANSHGCGFSYINVDNRGVRKIKIKKSLDFDTFYRQYTRAISIAGDSPFLIHFRIKTHGPVNIENCHPFRIDNEHVFIHNGIIKGMVADKDRSDTNRFNLDYLQKLPDGWMESEGVVKMITNMVDYGKIVVMNINGDIQICNEKKGEWVDGVWYSNTSYKKPTYFKGNTNTGTYTYPKRIIDTSTKKTRANDVVLNSMAKVHLDSREKCSDCDAYLKIDWMIPFYDFGKVSIFCERCTDAYKKGNKYKAEQELTPECYVDYLNETTGAEMDSGTRYVHIWTNPWFDADYQDVEDDEDTEEERQAKVDAEVSKSLEERAGQNGKKDKEDTSVPLMLMAPPVDTKEMDEAANEAAILEYYEDMRSDEYYRGEVG